MPITQGCVADTLARDSTAAGHQLLSFGPFCLDPVRRKLLEGGTIRRVGSRALEILIALAERPGEIITKNELMARVWPHSVVQEATLRVHIAALRKVLHDGAPGTRYVENFSGRGYRFVAEVSGLTDTVGERTTDFSSGAAYKPTWVAVPTHAQPGTRLTRIIGRAQLLSMLVERIPEQRFLTLVGPGGIGKTTVAQAAADSLSGVFAQGTPFIDLTLLKEPDSFGPLLATALGIHTTPEDALAESVNYLQDKRLLIVLDNCEHVIDLAARFAETLLRAAPNVHLLATSREPLRADGENVHRLAPLAAPPSSQTLSKAQALKFPAVQLFVERASANLDTFQLRDGDVPIVSEICHRLDGNPLAIELAAARMDLFDARALAARLDERFQLLTRGRRTAQPRHQNLRASVDWSYERLRHDDKLMLRRLAVFTGGFTLVDVIGLHTDTNFSATDIVEILADLLAKSLLIADFIGEHVVYRLTETVRLYALEKLREAGQGSELLLAAKFRSAAAKDIPTRTS